MFGATAVKSSPRGSGGRVDDGSAVVAVPDSFPPPHAARALVAPTATTAIAPPLRMPRRDIAVFTTSPKYSPVEVLGTSWKQASPHL